MNFFDGRNMGACFLSLGRFMGSQIVNNGLDVVSRQARCRSHIADPLVHFRDAIRRGHFVPENVAPFLLLLVRSMRCDRS